jgi:hypothetical protein
MQYTAKISVAFAVLASVAQSAPVANPQDYAALDWSSIDAQVNWASVFSTPAAEAATTAAPAPAATTPAYTQAAAPTTSAAAVVSVPAASSPAASTPIASATASASSSAASPSSSSSSSGGSSGSKRGLAFNDAGLLSAFTSSAISWAYNWGSSCTGLKSGLTYVPMLWGTASVHSASWSSDAANAIKSGSTHLLGFNEPDMPQQAALSPSDAVSAWGTYMEPFAGQAKLGSPAVSNSDAPNQGLDWMKQFLDACSHCTIDFIVIHWYQQGVTGAADAFKQHVTDAISAANGKPVWITEFGIFGASADDQAPFVKEVIPWLDSQAGVEGYSYFGALPAPNDFLVDSSGALTTAGQAYDS